MQTQLKRKKYITIYACLLPCRYLLLTDFPPLSNAGSMEMHCGLTYGVNSSPSATIVLLDPGDSLAIPVKGRASIIT